ncbi:MAG: MBL fold metallo-hydrolase, partial [Bacteroidetes bacterium]
MKNLFYTLLILSLSTTYLTGQNWDEIEIKPEKITENIYVLFGRGGNIGLYVSEDGLMMIDDQYAPLSEKISAAIAEISDQPIRFLLNTHWHGDHTGGNENFNKKGALLIAHNNVRKRLSTDQFMQAFGRNSPAKPETYWPEITFENDLTFHFGGEDIFFFHVHNAHTDGDAIVWFPKSNVIHMGDTFFSGRYPFIDISSGGSVEGVIEAANKVLFLADTDTKIIPGHGPVSSKADLQTYRDVLMTLRDRVQKAVNAGKTDEEIKAMNLTEGLPESWGTGFISAEKIVDIIYTDLT